MTRSLTVYTDAMESIANVVAGFISWYSLWIAAKPRDLNHPYGHGKVEYISSAIEGTLISVAGIIIIVQAIQHFSAPHQLVKLDIGIVLLIATGIINFIAGRIAINQGKKERSVALVASGKHLLSDTYTSIGVVIGLIAIKLTKIPWLDPVIAIVFALIIIYTGYKVLRRSLSGIMDEANFETLDEIIAYLNENRKPQWVDIHNLRMIQYGDVLHLDGHVTLPWYYNVRQAHSEIEALDHLIKKKYGKQVELFLHVDCCEEFSCKICSLENCPQRKHPFEKQIKWNRQNVLNNHKHFLS